MNDQHRGAYTPQTEAPLAFDARRTRGGGGGYPVPMTLLISFMVLVVLVIAIIFFYRGGVRGNDATPQLVGAPVAQTKAPAPDDQQPSDPAAGLQVYKSEAVPPSETQAAPKFAPPPETPAPRPAPKPQVVAQAALPAVQPTAAPAAAPAPSATAAATTSATPAAPVVAALKPLPAKPVKVAASAPTRPAKTPAKADVSAAPAATASAGAGKAWVQIGAFSSTTLADKGWSDTAAVMGASMSGKTRRVEATVKDGTTFYRAYVGGFASASAAQSFCASLKAAGKACFVR